MAVSEIFTINLTEIKKMIEDTNVKRRKNMEESERKKMDTIKQEAAIVIEKIQYVITTQFVGEIFIDDVNCSPLKKISNSLFDHRAYSYKDPLFWKFLKEVNKTGVVKVEVGTKFRKGGDEYYEWLNKIRCEVTHDNKYQITLGHWG